MFPVAFDIQCLLLRLGSGLDLDFLRPVYVYVCRLHCCRKTQHTIDTKAQRHKCSHKFIYYTDGPPLK